MLAELGKVVPIEGAKGSVRVGVEVGVQTFSHEFRGFLQGYVLVFRLPPPIFGSQVSRGFLVGEWGFKFLSICVRCYVLFFSLSLIGVIFSLSHPTCLYPLSQMPEPVDPYVQTSRPKCVSSSGSTVWKDGVLVMDIL